ncbi:MAG: hypothetical protein R3E87_22090 [Burkholderiaceae bacterium]
MIASAITMMQAKDDPPLFLPQGARKDEQGIALLVLPLLRAGSRNPAAESLKIRNPAGRCQNVVSHLRVHSAGGQNVVLI